MIAFLYDNLHDVIRTLMEKIVVSSVLHEPKAASFLYKIDLTKKDDLKKKPDISFGATAEINDVLKKDTVTNNLLNPPKKIALLSYHRF